MCTSVVLKNLFLVMDVLLSTVRERHSLRNGQEDDPEPSPNIISVTPHMLCKNMNTVWVDIRDY